MTGRTRNPPCVRDELILALDVHPRHVDNPTPKTSPEIGELSETLNHLGRYLGIATADFEPDLLPAVKGEGSRTLHHGGRGERLFGMSSAADPQRCRAVAAAGYAGDVEVEIFNADVWAADPDEVLAQVKKRYADLIAPFV